MGSARIQYVGGPRCECRLGHVHGLVCQDDEKIALARTSNANLRLCVDGVCRGTWHSAAGMCLIAYLPTGDEFLLVRAGKTLHSISSAFTAEAKALEWGVDFSQAFWIRLDTEMDGG